MTFFSRFMTKHFGGVPKKWSDLEWIYRVNPNTNPIVQSSDKFRTVSPGSQPDYKAPVNDKISNNHYFKRDVRREYPKTLVYTSNDVKVLGDGTTTTTSSSNAFIPPIINNRYAWKRSAPELKPDESNPEFSIKGYS